MFAPMQRYFIEIAYKGTRYHGWQKQDNAASVQEALDRALSTVLGEPVETLGCGRTDTGVHATQFFAHFDCSQVMRGEESVPEVPAEMKSFSRERMVRALNAIAGPDIAVKRIIPVHADAHARFDALSRSYEYHLHFHKDPFKQDLSWFYRWPLDVEAMNRLAKLLPGHTDFECFSKSNTQVNNFLCRVTEAYWEVHEDRLVFHISANRFLRNMVRAIVGTLMEAGKGQLDEAGLRAILESRNRSEAGTSVPAGGLYLTRVAYSYL